MKRGKDDEKMMMGPMFPRLHVNDAEKGGPRAPPRNKMALYEQLSIPSQRFNHASTNSQGNANDRGLVFSYQRPTPHQPEKQYSQYSDVTSPLTQVVQRKKLDEDDFRVPIFVHSGPGRECGEYNNDLQMGKFSSSSTSYFNRPRPLKIQKFRKMGMLESSVWDEDESQKEESSKELDLVISNSSTTKKAEGLNRQTDSSMPYKPRDCPANDIDRIISNDSVEPELCAETQPASKSTSVLREKIAALEKKSSSTSVRDFPSEDTESQEGSCRSLQMRKLERVDSLSETSVMDSVSRLDVTPDDIVGVIGQKRFWKARRAIVNQQRVFAVQLFELHRLIKVQKLIASSPHCLLDDSSYLDKPTKPSPGRKIQSNYPTKPIPNASNKKGESEKPNHKKESSSENTTGKASFTSVQNGVPPSSCRPLNGNSPAPSSLSSSNHSHNAGPCSLNQLHGHQWLIPVMSPTEGLVYKPYPGTGFVGPAGGGCGPPASNLMMGNFLTPTYGIPAQHPQYQLSAFPPSTPHGYFPPYGMPIMNAASFSGQVSSGEADENQNFSTMMPNHKKHTSTDTLNDLQLSKDVEVRAHNASSPVLDSRLGQAVKGKNVLPLFPTSPISDGTSTSPQHPKCGPTTRVIKVVPHDGRSASEFAARIFQSIQEERKQYDAV